MFFSLFNKKKAAQMPSPDDSVPAKDSPATTGGSTTHPGSGFANSIMALRHIARATERKIDAIEYEMSRDIIKKKSAPQPGPVPQQPNANTDLFEDDEVVFAHYTGDNEKGDFLEATILLSGFNTGFLLGEGTNFNLGHAVDQNELGDIPALEEAAILFANEQIVASETILKTLIAQNGCLARNHMAWLMLFDLYQITGNQSEFEQLATEYVNKMEISAPVWGGIYDPIGHLPADGPQSGLGPCMALSGALNAQNVGLQQQMDTLIDQAREHGRCQIEFSKLTNIDVVGCECLLSGFLRLKKLNVELRVIGIHDLIKDVRSIIAVGRRDENEAPWMLLLKLWQFANDKAAFEEASMEYCITYEVSPPPFEVPEENSAEMAQEAIGLPGEKITGAAGEAERIVLPPVIDGDINGLITQVAEFAERQNTVYLDCSGLNRIEFSACGHLLNGLIPISKQPDVAIVFQDVNHLVIMLLNAMGYINIAVMLPRKQ